MDFARFSFYHTEARSSYRARVVNNGVNNENSSLFDCPEIDSMKMNFLPLSFFHILKTSYHFTDPYVAMSIVPDEFDPNEQLHSLHVNLAAAGLIYRNANDLNAVIMSHYVFATNYFNSDQFEDESFSFASQQLSKLYKIFHKNDKDFILLFYTPAGFAVYRPSLVDMNEARKIGIVLSKKQIVNCDIENFSIQLCTPSPVSFQALPFEKPLSFCEFSLVQGTWQTKLNLEVVSQIFTNINSQIYSSRDCLTINFSAFAGIRSRIIGLIGRYSDIIKMFTPNDPNAKIAFIDLLNQVKKQLNPQIFYLPFVTRENDTKRRRGYSFMILYIPDDFMPNHPHYKEVTEYAYSFMRRACTITLLIPNVGAGPQKFHIFNNIQGLIEQANFSELLFFGSGESQIITLCDKILLKSMEFDDLSDFISWLHWVSPYYKFNFNNLSFGIVKDGISFDLDTTLNLIENELLFRNGERHFIDTILYGIFEHKSPEEIARMIVKTKNNDIDKLISEAVYLSKIAAEIRRPKCAVCNHRDYPNWTEEQKVQERTNHEFDKLCPWCCLKKLEAQNKIESTEAQNYKGKIIAYDKKELEFNKNLKKLLDLRNFSDLSQNPASENGSAYINIDPVFEFIKFLFEFWCKLNLQYGWDDLNEGNFLQLRNFDNVTRDENGSITDEMPSCIDTLSGDHIYIEKAIPDIDPYLQKLIAISKMYGHMLEPNQLFEGFQEYLVKKISILIKEVKPLPYSYFLGKYQERLSQLKKKFSTEVTPVKNKKDNPVITFKSIMATNKMSIKIDIDELSNFLDFKDYTFHYVDQLTDEKFFSKQLQGEKAAFLIHQPYHLKLVNSWRVKGGVLVLVAIGHKARLIYLPNNFRGRFIDHYLYETDISDSNLCYASFAPRPYTMCIVSDSTNSTSRYIILLQVSLDFTSAVEVKRRPLECLLPLPSLHDTQSFIMPDLNDEEEEEESSKKKKKKSKHDKKEEEVLKVETTFNGFIIDENASRGALGATIKCETADFTPINFLIEFDPYKLSFTKIHRLDFSNFPSFPITPLHFAKLPLNQILQGDDQKKKNEKSKPVKKEIVDAIVCISSTIDPNTPQNILIYTEKSVSIIQRHLDGLGEKISNKIGVSYYEGENILVFATKNQPPTLQSASNKLPRFPDWDDMFKVNFDASSIPEFVAGCNMKYGYSEVERVSFPRHLPYPVELVKFDVLNTVEGAEANNCNVDIFDSIKSAMKNVLPLKDGWSVPFRIYRKGHLTNTYEPDLNDIFQGKSNYEAIIGFVTRIVSIPQPFVNSIPKASLDASKYADNSIISMAVRMMMKFPPLPLLRGTYQRKTMTISLVDIGKDAEGSSIISSIAGIPFTKCLPGCVNVGVNYTPIFNTDQKNNPLFEKDMLTIRGKSVTDFNNIIACHFRPDRLDVTASNFVTIFCAMKCSDLVVINAGKQTQLLIEVLKLFIELVYTFNNNYRKLFDDEIKGGDEDEVNEIENPMFPFLKGLAFVTELGSDPTAKIHEIEKILSKELAFSNDETIKIFENKVTFVPSEFPVFEIARSIANEQMIDKDIFSNLRSTKDAYKHLIKSCGYFGSILSHIDNIMYTDKDEEGDEEASQNESDIIEISDDDEEEEEENDDE